MVPSCTGVLYQCPLGRYFCTEKIGSSGALLQKGTKIVPQRALFYGPSNGALRAPFQYRLFFSVRRFGTSIPSLPSNTPVLIGRVIPHVPFYCRSIYFWLMPADAVGTGLGPLFGKLFFSFWSMKTTLIVGQLWAFCRNELFCLAKKGPSPLGSETFLTPLTRCPIARHRTVNARPRTLLVYEGNESHLWFSGLLLYGVAQRDTVRCATPYICTMWPVIFFYILYCTVSRYRTAC